MLAVRIGGDTAQCFRHVVFDICESRLECTALAAVGTVCDEMAAASCDYGFSLFEYRIVLLVRTVVDNDDRPHVFDVQIV